MKALNDKDINLIEDFISGNLSSEEEINFQERLKVDTVFAKEYNFRIKISKFWNEAESYDTTIRKINDIIKTERNKKRRFVLNLSAAASVIFLIGFSLYFFLQTKQDSSENMVAETTKDTTKIQILSSNTQPQLGTQNILKYAYTVYDTLLILRPDDLQNTRRIQIKRLKDDEVIKEYVLESGIDTAVIPLNGIKPGNYKWVFVGTVIFEEFFITEKREIKE